MKKAILIIAFGVAFCFAQVSVVQAGPDDPVTERWAKRNLINKQKVTKIPICMTFGHLNKYLCLN